MIKSKLVISFILLGISSCCCQCCIDTLIALNTMWTESSPSDQYPQQRPNEEDIAGLWIPRFDTLELMDEIGYSGDTTTIEFSENGEFTMTDMPDLFLWESKGEYYSGSGSWRISDRFEDWSIYVNFSHLDPVYYPDPPVSELIPCPGESVPCNGLEKYFQLYRPQPPYVIIVDIGGLELDPDLYFIRQGDVHEEKPDEKEIIGVWVPREHSAELMDSMGYPINTTTIEFYENGEFTITDMPHLAFDRNNGDFYSGKGKWNITEVHGKWRIYLNFSSFDTSQFPTSPLSESTDLPEDSVLRDSLELFIDLSWKPPYEILVNIPSMDTVIVFFRDVE